jgi:3-oxoadipate enol-lactonase
MEKFDLYFQTQGNSKGLPIIFIHSFAFTHEMWVSQVSALPQKYFAVTYDIRGFGKSPVGDGQYTMEMFVDDLAALLNHLKLNSVVLCGLSLGGYIALRFAEKFPDHLKGLILCDTQSEADTNEGKINRAQSIQLLKTAGLSAFAEKFLPKLVSEQTQKQHPELLDRLRKTILAQNLLALCGGQLALLSRTDTTDFLAKISFPTLVIHGEEDALIPLNQAKAMSGRIPNSQLEVIPHAGHNTNLENPDLFNQALVRFLESLPSNI